MDTLVAVEVAAHQVDAVGPDDLEAQSGHRQAALQVGPLGGLDDLRVDQDLRAITQVVDEQALLDPT